MDRPPRAVPAPGERGPGRALASDSEAGVRRGARYVVELRRPAAKVGCPLRGPPSGVQVIHYGNSVTRGVDVGGADRGARGRLQTSQSPQPLPHPKPGMESWQHRPSPPTPARRAGPDRNARCRSAHDTSLRPLGLPRWSDHLDPFHRPTGEPPPKNPRIPSVYAPPPTAMQALLDVHDTPLALKPVGIR